MEDGKILRQILSHHWKEMTPKEIKLFLTLFWLSDPETGELVISIFRLSQKTKIPTILEKTVRSYDQNLAKIILPWALKNPRYLRTFIRLRKVYKKAEQTRIRERAAGVKVPPFMILSITSKCNLRCTGCYAEASGNISKKNQSQLS